MFPGFSLKRATVQEPLVCLSGKGHRQLTIDIGQINKVGGNRVGLAILSDTRTDDGSGDGLECIRLSRRHSGGDTAKRKSSKEEIEELHDVLKARESKKNCYLRLFCLLL